jgi:hypothetical protein
MYTDTDVTSTDLCRLLGLMKIRSFGTSLALVGTALLTMLSCEAANARIQCQGNFQMSKYGPIATPYCEEEQIAIVAQSYGWKVSVSEIHNDPLSKVYTCQILGSDSRLKGSCAGYGPDAYGGRR